jgi:hypothetical protein
MTDITFLGYLVGGLGSLIGLYFMVEKFGEKNRYKLEVLTKEVNQSNKDLTQAIHKLTTTVELMNGNMINFQKVQESHSVYIDELRDNMRNIQFRCALEHNRKLESME